MSEEKNLKNTNEPSKYSHEFEFVDPLRFLFRCRKCKKGTSPGAKDALKLREKTLRAGEQWPISMDDPELGKIEIRCPTCLNEVILIPAMLTDSKMVSDWWKKCQTEDFELVTFEHFRCRQCGNERPLLYRWAKSFKFDPKKPGDIYRGNYEPTEPTQE
jgi:hypothetical protein